MPIDRQRSSAAWRHNARQDFADKQMDLRRGEALANDPFVKQKTEGQRTFGAVALDTDSLKHAGGPLWPSERQPLSLVSMASFAPPAGRTSGHRG
jgi:hypothetical protein